MNGPDIEAVDEVNSLILESVNAWRNYTKRMPSRSSAGVNPSYPTEQEPTGQCLFLLDPAALETGSRRSKKSRMRVIFLKHWVSTSVTRESLVSVAIVHETLKDKYCVFFLL